MTYFNLSGSAGDHEHAERGADSEGSEEAITNEEKLGEEEQPEARAQIKYKEGLKRIYVVFVVCWVAFFLMFPIASLFYAVTKPGGTRHRYRREGRALRTRPFGPSAGGTF
jgi:hypothetical protein